MKGLRERVLSNLIIDPSGCLLWSGGLMKGYGVTSSYGRPLYVHRVMYEWFIGPIPDGLEIDHVCKVKRCAAPAHLEAVTHAENMRRWGGRHNAIKTACPRGHAYDEANTRHAYGRRFCRRCARDRMRAAA
jgi:hypothetical protein